LAEGNRMARIPERISGPEDLAAWLRSKAGTGRLLSVGVCGFPGAGKTTLCKSLSSADPDHFVRFECDRFSRHSYLEREDRIARALRTGNRSDSEENPLSWYAWNDIEAALAGLRSNGSFVYPHGWNRKTGELDEPYTIALPPARPAVLLCDCIHLLHSPVRGWFDAMILVDTPLDLTLKRGRKRSGDPARAAYMEHLTRTYTVPYFAAHRAMADVLFSAE
jgi:uridine kinase